MSDEWWVMKTEWWVTIFFKPNKAKLSKLAIQTAPNFLFMSKKMGQLYDVAGEHGIPMMAIEEVVILCNANLYGEGKIS